MKWVLQLSLMIALAGCSDDGAPELETEDVQVGSGFAAVNGTKIYYETKGEGTDVLLIHGFTLDGRMWDTQFDALSEHYRVTRLDLRGHGRSGPATDEFERWEDIRALMDALNIDRAHVIGLSLGGGIAADFVLRYPSRAISMTLIDAYYPIGTEADKRFVASATSCVDAAKSGTLEVGLRDWLNHDLFATARSLPDVGPRLEAIVMEGHLAQGEGAFFLNLASSKPMSPPAIDRLGEYRVPTLVIVGELDLPVFHEIAEVFATGIGDANKINVPNAGHMSNMENADFVTGQLLDFLSSQPNP